MCTPCERSFRVVGPRVWARQICLLLLVAQLGLASQLTAQTFLFPSEEELPKLPIAEVDKPRFMSLQQLILKNESEINSLYSSIPIGFPDQLRIAQEKIETLKKENLSLKLQLADAAVEFYRNNPAGNRQAEIIVLNQISDKLDGRSPQTPFDPQGAIELANLLLKSDSEERPLSAKLRAELLYSSFRAAYAAQDFDRAELMLKQIEELGIQLRPAITEKLALTKTQWEAELLIRRQEANTNDLPIVKIETTEGNIVVELFENHAPATVANFIYLIEEVKFYDGLEFFLVRPGEYALTGCNNNDGSGDPGYYIPCECYGENIRHHFAGTLTMFNQGKNTGGSQFLITHQPNPKFGGNYTAFGRVTEGMDVLYRLKNVDRTNSRVDRPASQILSTTVLRKRDHSYSPTRLAKDQPTEGGSDQSSPSVQTARGIND